MIFRRLLALAIVVIAATACEEDESSGANDAEIRDTCTLEQRYALKVTVRGVGDPDGGTIMVTATDGDYHSALSCQAATSLVCSGVSERPGTYLIEVIVDDEVVASEEVTVIKENCHVVTAQVVIEV